MRFWDVTGPEVEAADAAPWDGPMASTTRSFTTYALSRIVVSGVVLYTSGGAGMLLIYLTARSAVAHPLLWLVLALWVTGVGLGLGLLWFVVTPTPCDAWRLR